MRRAMRSCLRWRRRVAPLACVAFAATLLVDAGADARVRKSYSAMTAQEQDDFVAALLALKAVDPGAQTAALDGYDDFVVLHLDYGMTTIHWGPAFLAWHREYLLRLEDALRSVNGGQFSNVTIPYWDWTSDPFPAFLGGGGGAGSIVTTGPFAYSNGNWTLNVGAPTPELRRAMNLSNLVLPTGAQVAAVLQVGVYDSAPWPAMPTVSNPNAHKLGQSAQPEQSLRNAIEGWRGLSSALGPLMHNRVHVSVAGGSGQMGNMSSPNDPIFWMHHAQIDRLWCQWQEANSLALHYLPLGGTYDPLSRPSLAWTGHNVYDALPGFPARTSWDTLNPQADGVEYDDCAGPCQLASGVTSSQFMIETET
jgi:tyrosinase